MHNMSVFFSGTDWDTLLEHSSDYPYFVSLIVNTKGDAIAKVGLQGYKEGSMKYSYKFNRGFIEKEPVIEKIEVIYVYDCIVNIENNVDEEFNKLLEIKKEKQVARSLANKSYIGGFESELLNDRNNWKSQFNKVGKDDWYTPKLNFDKPTKRDTKGKTLDFLISCILQDATCERCDTISYSQAKEDWDETVGVELLKGYTEYVEEVIDDIFYTIFTEEYTLEELAEFKTHISVIMGKHVAEEAIKPIIKDLIELLTETKVSK